LSLLVHLLVEAEADRSGESVHNCVEAIAADLGPSLIPAAPPCAVRTCSAPRRGGLPEAGANYTARIEGSGSTGPEAV